jgi:hypothetical protein
VVPNLRSNEKPQAKVSKECVFENNERIIGYNKKKVTSSGDTNESYSN